MKVNWKHILVIVIIAGCLVYMTRSFFMSLGIIMLLFVVDYFLQKYDNKHKK